MKLLHELISDHSVRLADKTAVKDHRSEMTYGELEKYSSMFSRKLQAIGVKKGDFVAIYVPRIKEVVTGAISVLRAGGIYVPFDDCYPVKRLEYMLKDANAAAILTTREQWSDNPLSFPESKVVFLDEKPDISGDFTDCDSLSVHLPQCCFIPQAPPETRRACCTLIICCFILTKALKILMTLS